MTIGPYDSDGDGDDGDGDGCSRWMAEWMFAILWEWIFSVVVVGETLWGWWR